MTITVETDNFKSQASFYLRIVSIPFKYSYLNKQLIDYSINKCLTTHINWKVVLKIRLGSFLNIRVSWCEFIDNLFHFVFLG